MATCCLSQTGAIFVLLAISKPCIRFRWSLYRFQPKSPHLSSGTLGFPSWVQVQPFLSKSCICITTASRISYHVHVLVVYYVLCFFPVFASSGWFRQRRVCEDPFVYVHLSSSWTRSSSLWDFRQDDRTLEITSIFALLDARSFAMPMLRCLPFACQPPKLPCQTSNPPCPRKPLIGYVTALLSPSIALLVAGEDWRPFLVGTLFYLLGYHYIALLS